MQRFAVVVVGLLACSAANANPVSLEVARAKQVPGTLHVQLSYAYDGAVIGAPTKVTRDGATLSGSWIAFAGFTANTGSGLKSLAAHQLCDCGVSVGQHAYVVTVNRAGKDVTVPVSITVVSNLEEPKDAGAPTIDFQPWDIPEPNPIQGLACKTACATPAGDGPKRDAQVPSVDKGALSPDKGTSTPPAKDEGGCSLGGSRGGSLAAGLALLLALGLLGAALRRR